MPTPPRPPATHFQLESLDTGTVYGPFGTTYTDAFDYPARISARQLNVPAGHYRAHFGVIRNGKLQASSGKVVKAE